MMQRVSAELADIALRNAAFGDSLSGIAQQAQFLTTRLNELWDQGMRPGDAVMDAMIEKLDKLKLKLMVLPELAQAMTDITFQLGAAFVNAESAAMSMVDTILSTGQQIIGQLLKEAFLGILAGEARKGLPGLITAAIGIGALTAMWNQYKNKAMGEAAHMQYGGIVPGPIGAPVPIIAHGGEQFAGVGKSMGGTNIYIGSFMGDESSLRTFAKKIQDIMGQNNRRTSFSGINKWDYFPGSSSV